MHIRIPVPNDLLGKFQEEEAKRSLGNIENSNNINLRNATNSNDNNNNFSGSYPIEENTQFSTPESNNNAKDNNRELQNDQLVNKLIQNFCKLDSLDVKSVKVSNTKNEEKIDTEKTILNNKINELSIKLSGSETEPYLPKVIKNCSDESPFELMKRITNNDKLRISVTQILSYTYCELKKIFQIYLKDIEIKTDAMQKGTQLHRGLEVVTHPQITAKIDTVETDENGEKNSRNFIELDKPKELFVEISKMSEASNITKTDIVDNVDIDSGKVGHKFDSANKKWDRKDTSLVPKEYVEHKPQSVGTLEENMQTPEKKTEPSESMTTSESTIVVKDTVQEPAIGEFNLHLNFHVRYLQAFEYKLSQTLFRLLNLLQYGECREILVHGLYSKKSNKLMENLEELEAASPSDLITISGIVDNLRIESKHSDAFKTYQEELQKQLTSSYDFDTYIQSIQTMRKQWIDPDVKEDDEKLLYITVSDDKTRQRNDMPYKPYQKDALNQAMIYRLLISNLSKDVGFCYKSLSINLDKRGIELYKTMSNELTNACLVGNNFFLNDFKKLKNGKLLNTYCNNKGDLESTPFIFQNLTNDKRFDDLNGKWEIPPTPSLIISRLAQVHSLLDGFFGNTVSVVYINQANSEVIGSCSQRYTEDSTNSIIKYGMDMWNGRRNPEPAKSKNMCNYCIFKDKCQVQLEFKGLMPYEKTGQ